jgi:Gpi18-like mannosyltransferase
VTQAVGFVTKAPVISTGSYLAVIILSKPAWINNYKAQNAVKSKENACNNYDYLQTVFVTKTGP